MRCSIVIVAYNSRSYLPACLDSVLADCGAQDEIIVVDNGSTDGSVGLIRAHYPCVSLVCNENNGYAGGNNRGAAVAQGAYLVFLNPDTVLQAGALSALLAPLEQRGDVALTTPCIVHMHDPTLINACGNTVHYTGLAYCRGAGRHIAEYQRSCDVDAISGAAFAIRRDVFGILGGFDERLFMYVEDTDLSWRARLGGYRCMYVADAVVAHDYRPAYSPNKAFYLDRNRHVMLLKTMQRATYTALLPGLLLSECVTWGFLLLKGPRYWGVKLRVYRWLWAARKALRAARQDAKTRCWNDGDVATMTYRLEFGQLASRPIASFAALLFHPAFWAAQRLLTPKRS